MVKKKFFLEQLGGRKFILSVLAMTIATGLIVLGKIEAEVGMQLILGVLIAYGVVNVGKSFASTN